MAGSCKIELAQASSKEDLTGRLRQYIKALGNLDVGFLTDAAKHFFEESTRWRQTDVLIQISAEDQQIDVTLPEGIGCRVMGSIHLQIDGSGRNRCDEYEIYRRKDGNQSWHRNVDEKFCSVPMAFYEPHPGTIVFSEPFHDDYTLRLELALWPETFDAIDYIPKTIMDKYREGLTSLAISKAMEMPDRPWTTPAPGYSPRQFGQIHAAKASAAIRSAKRYHTSDLSNNRPFGDRMSASRRSRDHAHSRWTRYGYRNGSSF